MGIFMRQAIDPRWKLIASMCIFGSLGLFVRHIPVSSGELALYRAVLAALTLAILLAAAKQRIALTEIKKEAALLMISGMLMGLNWVLLFEAYKRTTVSAATLSYYFAPVIVMAVCPFLFHERLSKKQLLCFFMSSLGLVLISIGGDSGSGQVSGIFFGLGAAVLYATVVLVNKFITNVTGLQRTFLQFLAAIVILLPYVGLGGELSLGQLKGWAWFNLLTVGFIHTALTYCLYFSALKDLSGQQIAIISYVDPLVAVLVSVTILGESITGWQLMGGCLILGFTLWNELSPARR